MIDFIFKCTLTSLYILCHDLLSLIVDENYATLKVNAGMEAFLVQHPSNAHLFCFVPLATWKGMGIAELPDGPKHFKVPMLVNYLDVFLIYFLQLRGR